MKNINSNDVLKVDKYTLQYNESTGMIHILDIGVYMNFSNINGCIRMINDKNYATPAFYYKDGSINMWLIMHWRDGRIGSKPDHTLHVDDVNRFVRWVNEKNNKRMEMGWPVLSEIEFNNNEFNNPSKFTLENALIPPFYNPNDLQ